MGDIALQWSIDAGAADIAIDDDDVATDDGLRTAVLLSLFADRRAENGDPLPGEDDDLRGWWGDEFADDEGDRIGSRLWLLDRSKVTSGLAARVVEIVRESLAWMIQDRVAAAVEPVVEINGGVLSLTVTITRPAGDAVSFRFAHTWEAEENLVL